MNCRYHRQYGMTLVEVLIALGILSLLLSLLYGAFYALTRSSSQITQRSNDTENVQAVRSFLRNLLANAQPLAKQDGTAMRLLFNGSPTDITLVGTLPYGQGQKRLQFIHLQMEQETLYLYYAPVNQHEEMPELTDRQFWQQHPLLDNMDVLRFSYYGQKKNSNIPRWSDDWQSEIQLPTLIRLEANTKEGKTWPLLTVNPRQLVPTNQPRLLWH